MKVGDLVKNNYNEVGVITEEWIPNWYHCEERQYYVLYTNGSVVVRSEYDLEVVSEGS